MSERTALEIWWDRGTAQRRQALVGQYPLPHDGASWACMVLFFGVVGLADPTYDVKYVYIPADDILDLWPKRRTWLSQNE